MWIVTTESELPGEREERRHEAPAPAWNDYLGRLLDFEIDGFLRDREGVSQYGKRWAADLSRGEEHVSITIERAA